MHRLLHHYLILALRSMAVGCGVAAMLVCHMVHAQNSYLAAYSFDNNTVSGNTVADVSGNGLNGSLLSGVTTGQSGVFGQAFYFSGSNSEVNAPAPYTFGNDFSISLWLNTGDLAQSQKYLLLHGTAETNQNAIIYGYIPNTVEFYAPGRTGSDPRPSSQITLSQANAWNNVIYTYDGSNFRGYLNGSQVFANAISFSLNATGPLYIGSASQSYPIGNYVGLLDDVGIFNTALTSSQVSYLQTHASLSSVPETSSLLILGIGLSGLGLLIRRVHR